MRRSLAKFSESEASNHTPSLAGFIITMSGFKFLVHTWGPGTGLVRAKRPAGLINRKGTLFQPHLAQSLCAEGFAMASKFAIGDKVDQAFSNHAEGTIVAVFTDRAGESRYAVEMFGHRTIQIASETSLIAHANRVV
jgi:hypothetical protein